MARNSRIDSAKIRTIIEMLHTRPSNHRRTRAALRAGISSLALLLLGCAGGGGGGTSPSPYIPPVTPPTPPPPSPTANDYRTPEYALSWALEAIGGAEAYALGATGKGVTIGFVDFNFELSNTEVNYDAASRGPNAQAIAWYTAQIGEAPDTDTHGHMVAAVAAGAKNSVGVHGIAFNAKVLAVDYFSNVNETQLPLQGALYHISDPWTYLTDRGARIIGKSFGYDDEDIIAPTPGRPRPFDRYIVDLPAIAIDNGALLIASAGNNFGRGSSRGANPIRSNLDIIDDIVDFGLTGGPGAFMIVGAVDSNRQITSFSNRAGIAREYFIVAPGLDLVAPYNGGLYYVSGTSVSAPLVAGAAALVMERWPALTARQVADILFTSATDLGAPGTDAIYGRGLLNVAAALRPLGVSTLSVAGGSVPVASSAMMLGPAFGDAPNFRAAISDTPLVDGFGRDFRFDASQLALIAPAQTNLLAIVKQGIGWRGTDIALPFAHVSVGFNNDAAFSTRADNGLETARSPRGALRLSGGEDMFSWVLGTGVSLAHDNGEGAVFAAPLTRAFAPAFEAADGGFAGLNFTTEDGSTLSVSVAAGGEANVTRPKAQRDEALPARRDLRMASISYSRSVESFRLRAEFGAAVETGTLLGTYSAGGLGLGQGANSFWSTATAFVDITPLWSVMAGLTFTRTQADAPSHSLVTSIAPIIGSAFSLGLARAHIFNVDDSLSFSLSQKLRAERADVVLSAASSSLVPSGRELALELGYRTGVGAWLAGFAAAHRFDAGHVAGRHETSGLVTLTRLF